MKFPNISSVSPSCSWNCIPYEFKTVFKYFSFVMVIKNEQTIYLLAIKLSFILGIANGKLCC